MGPDEILTDAQRLRRGFELFKSETDSSLSSFPSECCDFATWICLLFFHANGFEGLRDLRAHVSASDKHRWLEVDGLTVDITADQFGQAAVIVSPDSAWHTSLTLIENEAIEGERLESLHRKQFSKEVLARLLEWA
jgi:hypothetical protein